VDAGSGGRADGGALEVRVGGRVVGGGCDSHCL
jgi:hypothetical protein